MKKIYLILVLFANYSYAQITHNTLRKNLTDAQISNLTDAVPGDTYISSDSNKIYSINQFGLAAEENNEIQDVISHWKADSSGGLYITNDIVNYNGSLYKSLAGVNSNATPDLDNTNWVKQDFFIVGDIKQGFQLSDHQGWIKLDGRLISTLSVNQQANVSSLSFSGNLPDATASVLIQNDSTLGSVTGSNTKTIAQENLPNVTLAGSGIYYDSKKFNGEITNGNSAFGTTNNILDYSVTNTINVDVPLGGSGTPLDVRPQTLSVNTFVYLGY